jgi:hypothetical protein
MTFGLSNDIGHPALKRFSSSHDDHFAEPSLTQFDQPLPDNGMPENPSLDQENKLLSFTMLLYNFTLFDY